MKRLFLILLCSLFATFLVGSNNKVVVEELDKELEERIKIDFSKQNEFTRSYDIDTSIGLFYGIYNGAVVFFMPTGEMYEKTSYISGLPFYYSSGFRIIVWKDGKFYDLEKPDIIFENHILTINDIERIHTIHSKLLKDKKLKY